MLIILIVPNVYAEDTIAEYIIEYSSYDEQTEVYTAEVYLNTSEYLSSGTFGLQYDAAALPKFELDENNFEKFQEFASNGQNYMVFQWYISENAPEQSGKIHMGTITINNVKLGSDGLPIGWHTKTLRQLDWYDTPESQESKFTDNADGICLNDEIYRKYEDGSEFYQGYDMEDMENPRWVDIGFRFKSGFDLPERSGLTISGVVHSYNPNNAVTATLYDQDDNVYSQIQANTTVVQPSGRVSSMYEFVLDIVPGTYTLEIKKDVHLTYRVDIEVNGSDISVGDITLYCGDINADEKIKLNDRTELLKHLNQQSGTEPLVSDLNGDGKVTLFDLSVMKLYYNRSYEEVVSYAEK